MAEGNSEVAQEFDFLSTVKTILSINNTVKDTVLNIYIMMTKNAILNYCHITELPSALNYTLCMMTADVYRENVSQNNSGSVVGSVSSISEDGRTVAFSNGSEIKASIEDKISRTSELRRFRKLYVI